MAGYTRQDTANNIANGNVIDADDFDAEYNAIESAFNASTGHSHDGTAGEGAPIEKVGPSQDLVVSATQVLPKTTNTLDLGSSAVQFKDAFFDGTVDADAFTGPITGNVTGNVTGNLTGDVTGTVSDISNHTTDVLTEGTTNLYYTDGRVRNAVSATGSINYNSATGVFSFTQGSTDTVAEGSSNLYFTTQRARDSVSATGSLSYNSGTGVFSYTQGNTDTVAEGSSNLYYTDARVQTYISGNRNYGNITSTGNVIVQGNLTVSGSTTTVNTETINLADNVIVLNSNEAGTPSQNGGIEIERGTAANKTFLWNEATDKWTVGNETLVAGTFEGNLTGNVTGNLTGAVTGNASTASTLQTARTITLNGDVSGSASFNGGSNITITATVADDSHNHTISNVDGLQTALNGKAALAGSTSQDFSVRTLSVVGSGSGKTTHATGDGILERVNGQVYLQVDDQFYIRDEGAATNGYSFYFDTNGGNFTATGNVTAYSDERLKSDIVTISDALSKVKALRGVNFTKDGEASTGVIAQEVQQVVPEVVQDNGDYLSVAYGNLVGILIEAVKELSEEVEALKAK